MEEIRTLCYLCFVTFLSVMLITIPVLAKRDPEIYCGACSALVDEVQYAIDKEDPRRKIDVGSFRIDPNGKRKHDTIPYAGSEVHLHEVVEDICNKMADYALKTDPDTRTTSFVRFQARGDEPIELEHVSINAETGKMLKIACGNVLEDFEDDLIAHFKAKTVDIYEELCVNIAGYCKPSTDKDEL